MSTTGPDPKEILAGLRWDVDSLVMNPFGERVWLKASFDATGKRSGITDCCFEEAPCSWHASIARRSLS